MWPRWSANWSWGFISAPGYGGAWAYFVYPYSLIAIIGAGLAVRRLPAVLALASAPAVGLRAGQRQHVG